MGDRVAFLLRSGDFSRLRSAMTATQDISPQGDIFFIVLYMKLQEIRLPITHAAGADEKWPRWGRITKG